MPGIEDRIAKLEAAMDELFNETFQKLLSDFEADRDALAQWRAAETLRGEQRAREALEAMLAGVQEQAERAARAEAQRMALLERCCAAEERHAAALERIAATKESSDE